MDKEDIPTFVIVVEDNTACPFLIRDVVDKCNLADYRDCEGPDGSSCPLCSCIVAVKSKKFWEEPVINTIEDCEPDYRINLDPGEDGVHESVTVVVQDSNEEVLRDAKCTACGKHAVIRVNEHLTYCHDCFMKIYSDRITKIYDNRSVTREEV